MEAAGLHCAPNDQVWGEAYFDYPHGDTDAVIGVATTPSKAVLDFLADDLLPIPLSTGAFMLVSRDSDRARYVVHRDDDPRLVLELMRLDGIWVPYRLAACGELVPADPATAAPGF
jgi:hypothetical protein